MPQLTLFLRKIIVDAWSYHVLDPNQACFFRRRIVDETLAYICMVPSAATDMFVRSRKLTFIQVSTVVVGLNTPPGVRRVYMESIEVSTN